MDSELLKILSDELRETRRLTLETRAMADAAQKHAEAAMIEAKASMRKAESSWELVVITRNEVEQNLAYLRLPWWKKIFGTTP
jgi:hypothetical protein